MNKLLLVGFGGFIGSVCRWLLGVGVDRCFPLARLPVGTLLVNLLGCLLAGTLYGLAERQTWVTPELRLLLFTGFLGGFTTFSAFGLETMKLLERAEFGVVAVYLSASVVLGLIAVWFGWKVLAMKMG